MPGHAPSWLRRWHDPEADPDETQNYFVLDSTAAPVWMANYGAIELHPWTSRLPDAPVSIPITWDELDDPDLAGDHWTIATALDRLRRAGDPPRPLIGRDQTLPPL